MINRYVFLVFLVLLANPLSAEIEIKTPLEKTNFSRLSNHADMLAYVKKLDAQSDVLQMSIIGKSVENREIPALFFTLNSEFAHRRADKPVVLIFCQQHGNEPSGKEAALILARSIAEQPQNFLKNIDLILVPQVNPDGSEKGQRRNANEMDLNRNHVILSEPESLALHRLFLKWMPEVTLDIHEYNAISKSWISHGIIKDAEEMLGGVTNINISPEIIRFTVENMLPAVGEKIESQGFRFARYIVGSPFDGKRVRYSTTAINDGRQSMGIYDTFSFLIEGKRYGDLITNIERRTKGQHAAMLAFLQVIAEEKDEILKIVRKSRKLLTNPEMQSKKIAVQMDYFRDPGQPKLKFPVFELATWHHIETAFDNYYPVVKTVASVSRPHAYIFPASEKKLITLLNKHQVDLKTLKSAQDILVTVYTISHVTERLDEEKPIEYADVHVASERKNFAAGSIVMTLDQKAANLLPLILEPTSTWNIAKTRAGRKYRFKKYLQEGEVYPVFRIEKTSDLDIN